MRNQEAREEIRKLWKVPVYATIEVLLQRERLTYVIVAVSKPNSFHVLSRLADLGIPVLTETPAASKLEEWDQLYERSMYGFRIQVAEQFHFHPFHASWLNLLKSEMLGQVNQVLLSAGHAYHGMSLIRKYLGIINSTAELHAFRHKHS